MKIKQMKCYHPKRAELVWRHNEMEKNASMHIQQKLKEFRQAVGQPQTNTGISQGKDMKNYEGNQEIAESEINTNMYADSQICSHTMMKHNHDGVEGMVDAHHFAEDNQDHTLEIVHKMMTVHSVLMWFNQIGFGKYIKRIRAQFQEDNINGRALCKMDMIDLKTYGIHDFYDRKIILKE